eukprot:TRINITY_DN26951_c0_g1_i1.p1 TRINITY_DN26951_c0_g1~~TRINITY_DN26951_c0_g1_i1.p1  ORF type:complete len:467 (-),score=57.79 TRINITY_DN26951_c0_g1_i1:110-1510(-)
MEPSTFGPSLVAGTAMTGGGFDASSTHIAPPLQYDTNATVRDGGFVSPARLHMAARAVGAPIPLDLPPSPPRVQSPAFTFYQAPTSPVSPPAQVDAILERAGYRGLEIHNEDCVAQGEILAHPPEFPVQVAPHAGAPAKVDRVFVQQEADVLRFSAVPADKLRQSRKMGRSKLSKRHGNHRVSDSLSCSFDSHRIRLSSLDPDSSCLQPADALDVEIHELLVGRLRCETHASFLFFVCQCLIGGLCCVAGLLANAEDEQILATALSAVEPGLTRFTLIIGEVALIGSLLEGVGQWYQQREDCGRLSTLNASVDDGVSRRRAIVMRNLINGIRMIANLVLVFCCLLGGRGDVALRHGLWLDHEETQRQTSPPSFEKIAEDGWSASLARNLLSVQLLMGLTALAFTVPRGLELLAGSSPPVFVDAFGGVANNSAMFSASAAELSSISAPVGASILSGEDWTGSGLHDS